MLNWFESHFEIAAVLYVPIIAFYPLPLLLLKSWLPMKKHGRGEGWNFLLYNIKNGNYQVGVGEKGEIVGGRI